MIQPAIGLLVAAIDRVAEVAERVSRAAEAQDRSGFDAAMLELRGPAGRLYEVWDALLNEPHLRASSFVFKQMGERDAASGTVGVASTSYGGGQRGNRYSNK